MKHPDGTAEAIDIVTWLITRKGGINAHWKELEDGQRAIKNMRKEVIDFGKIQRQHEALDEEAKRKEEKRLANKQRYRPRNQWKQRDPQTTDLTNKRPRGSAKFYQDCLSMPDVMLEEKPTTKKQRLETADE